jgi:hypothetical protein
VASGAKARLGTPHMAGMKSPPFHCALTKTIQEVSCSGMPSSAAGWRDDVVHTQVFDHLTVMIGGMGDRVHEEP